MSTITDEIDAQVAELKAAGFLRVVTRLQDVQPPCIWVAVDELDHFNYGGDLKLALIIIPGGVDEYRALATAGDTLVQLLEHVSPADVTRTVSVDAPNNPQSQAGLKVTVQRPIDLTPSPASEE